MRLIRLVLPLLVLLTALAPAVARAAAPPPGPAVVHGVTLDGLQDWLPAKRPALARSAVLSGHRIAKMEAQIDAAKRYWHANTIRLQIVQDKLAWPGFSQIYLTQVSEVTSYALGKGLYVVLNANTEGAPHTRTGEPMPTASTYQFWGSLLALYGNDPHVILDLFNEPRHCSWAQWGAKFQRLVSWVRHRAGNTIWVEGRLWGSTLAGVPMLQGGGVVYTFHHPGKPWPHSPGLPEGPRLWDQAFGDLASSGVPVVDGEFVNYAGGYHFDRPGKTVPEYLRYLSAHHIGLTSWTLGLPGPMNATKWDLSSASHEPYGDGALLKAWYAALP